MSDLAVPAHLSNFDEANPIEFSFYATRWYWHAPQNNSMLL